MTEEIRVTGTFWCSEADIKAQLTEEGGVRICFEYKKVGQRRHEFTCTPEEWDSFVTWVEWQHKERVINKEES